MKCKIQHSIIQLQVVDNIAEGEKYYPEEKSVYFFKETSTFPHNLVTKLQKMVLW